MVDESKSFEVSEDGITLEDGVHISSGSAAPTHTAPEGSRYFRTTGSFEYIQTASPSGSTWQSLEFIDVSTGVADAGKPIKADSGGQIDGSLVNEADDVFTVVSNTAAPDVIFDTADALGGFTVKKSDASGFMAFMPNSNVPQILAGDNAAAAGANTTYIDSDNEGVLALNTLPGAGRLGEIIATYGAPLRPGQDETSDLGTLLQKWKEIHGQALKLNATTADDNIQIEKSNSTSHWLINAGRVAFYDNWLLFKNENEAENFTLALTNTGSLRGRNGSAGSPTYGFDEDSNLGMYRAGTGELCFSSAGIPRLSLESDGTLNTGSTANYEALVTSDDDIPNKKYVDDAITTAGSSSIDDLTDVDTTTSAPSVDDLLTWDGSNWVPYTLSPNVTRNNALAIGSIGSASNSANQNFQIDLSDYGFEVGDTVRLANAYVRGDLSGDGTEYIDVGFGTSGAAKTRLGDTGYDDIAIFRTDGGLIDQTYTLTDIGGGDAGLQVYVSPSIAVNFSPSGMPSSWWWQLKVDVAVV